MKSFYRVMLGRKSVHASECLAEGFIGADFGIEQDLSQRLPDNWRAFNAEFIPVFLTKNPDKSKIAAGLSCGMLWVVSKGIKTGDVVLSPDGNGTYRVGDVVGDYAWVSGQTLPHRRKVTWREVGIDRSAMSDSLRHSAGSIGTVCDISIHREEIERLLGSHSPTIVGKDPQDEELGSFAMEKHLEDFLVANWSQTELGRDYDIYSEDGETTGQQYQTDTGPLDILAISKDRKELLVVELKRARASDAVVGQILRYMGYVQEMLASDGQTVRGAIIALEDDPRIRRALSMTPAISFYRYQVSFKLVRSPA